MSSSLPKIGAIVLFATGIVGFVAYRSGFFDEEAKPDQTEEVEVTQQKPQDNETVDEPEDTVELQQQEIQEVKDPHIISSDETQPVILPSSKSITVFNPDDFKIPEHMSSSKSAPIFMPSDFENGNTPNPDSLKRK